MIEERLRVYLQYLERGTVRRRHDTYAHTNPDRPSSGRFVIPGVTPHDDPGLTFEEAKGRYDVAWVPARQSTASRRISQKGRGSVRGSLVDHARWIVLTFESMLEYYLANILMADPNCKRIEDQPPAVKYFLGKPMEHYFDFRSTSTSNYRIAYNVKPAEFLERDRTLQKIDAIKSVHIPRFANQALIVTENEITREKGLNAVDINDARKERNQADCDQVHERLLSVGKPIQIWKLQDMIGDLSMVWNALLCLFFDRKVHIQRPGVRFSDERMVVAA
ncbi:hypothetical protein [Shinella sp.]|uniref:hypothetical protein n=1 Tax=Shinella sp. TaxID=1870904 RepID=UPI0028A0BAED|nr:hypothetical protein [Shinella sp.]